MLAFVISNISNIFLTIKWQRLAKPLKIKSNFWDLYKLNYIAIFYSSFLPGQSSGELIKGYKFAKKENAMQKVWIPIFIDKITNLLIIFLIGFVAILSDETFRQNTTLVIMISSLTLFLSLLTIILFSEKTEKIIHFLRDQLVTVLKMLKVNTKLIEDFSLSYFENYKKHNHLMFESLLWGLFIKLPHVFSFYLLAFSLNLGITFLQTAWLFSIVSVVTLIPISFSGLGVREGTLIMLLSQIGIERFNALSFSILIFTMGLLTAVIGGIVELFPSTKSKQ